MIDIHTHILPHVDDGAEDLQDAILMAELSVESGVQAVFATPHSNLPDDYPSSSVLEMQRQLSKLKYGIREKGIPLVILSGMEIFVTEDIVEKIRNRKVISMNGSNRYLVEFGFHRRSAWITEQLEQMLRNEYSPIIAHPERYVCVQRRPELVLDWLDMGCQVQINKGSFFGNFGHTSMETAHQLLNHRAVTYIASDAHTPYQRTTYMKDIYEFLRSEYSKKLARTLLWENPYRYLIAKTD